MYGSENQKEDFEQRFSDFLEMIQPEQALFGLIKDYIVEEWQRRQTENDKAGTLLAARRDNLPRTDELCDLHGEPLEIETVLNFAEHVFLNASRMWNEVSTEQKQRLQNYFFQKESNFRAANFEPA